MKAFYLLDVETKPEMTRQFSSSTRLSNVCRRRSASYVSQTTRNLHTRISEHLGISPITGKQSTNPAISSILSHINAFGHLANSDDFQILSSSSDSYELMIHESLLINKYNLILMFKEGLFFSSSSKSSFMLYVFVTSYPLSYFHIFH